MSIKFLSVASKYMIYQQDWQGREIHIQDFHSVKESGFFCQNAGLTQINLNHLVTSNC